MSGCFTRAAVGAEHGVGLPELVGVLHAEGEAFLVVVVLGREQVVLADEAVEGGLGDAVGIQQALLDAEAIEGALVGAVVVEVGLGGVEGFEQFLGRDLAGLALVLAGLVGHAGDAVVLVAVEPGLDGAPGELAGVAVLVEEGHGGDVVDAFVAGASRRRCRRHRGRASSNRPKAASWSLLVRWGRARGFKHAGVRPTTTACVAGDFGCFSPRSAERRALAIWWRRASDRRLGQAESGVVDGSRWGEELRGAIESEDEGSGGMLKSGERVGVGEGGFEMGEDLGDGPCREAVVDRRWRVPVQQEGADVALAEAEALPETLPGSVTEPADVARGGGDAVGDGALEEPPQQSGGQAQASDVVGEPDAEGASAPGAGGAVAAKDPPGPDGFFAGESRRRSRAESHAE